MAEGEPAAKRVRLNDDGTPEGTTPSAVREMDQPVQPPADTHFFFLSVAYRNQGAARAQSPSRRERVRAQDALPQQGRRRKGAHPQGKLASASPFLSNSCLENNRERGKALPSLLTCTRLRLPSSISRPPKPLCGTSIYLFVPR